MTYHINLPTRADLEEAQRRHKQLIADEFPELGAKSEPSLIQEISAQIGTTLARGLDERLMKMISARIGPVLDISALKGRLVRSRVQGQKQEAYYLDGEPFAIVEDVEVTFEGGMVNASQRVWKVTP